MHCGGHGRVVHLIGMVRAARRRWGRPAQHWTDAIILWFDVNSSKGAVRLDDGRTKAFVRHELPPGLSDSDLRGVARLRVRMADFRFGSALGCLGTTTGLYLLQ